ncbi:MAG: aconitase X catalytic domain-containing protein [Candidatus Methanomethyliaceae archaeon]|nr:aconitase X catalytic domain-containing protein [Candidatus Methanomethyliaceae archaeon]
MYLSREEERMLSGEEGAAVQKAMQLLTALGEVFGAERMVKVESAQIAGVSYGNIGDAGMEFLEDWANLGGKVRVKATLNPAGMDLNKWQEMGVDGEYYKKQIRILKAFEKMGVEITCTCTPYLVGNRPRFGAHVAWSESSAVVFANSVLGARTNREGGPSALAAAITGRTPCYGLHIEDNREPTAIVKVEARMRSIFDFSLLGYTVGRILGSGIPYLKGVSGADLDRLKIMSAALAASGGIAMFHSGGRLRAADKLEKVCVDQRELELSREKLSSEGKPDLACIGCPHCSLQELKDLARAVKGKKVKKGCALWVWTSNGVYDEAKDRGYLSVIEGAGGKVFTDTCMVVCPLEKSGYTHMVSNSCKAAHYVPSTSGLRATVTETYLVLESIMEGR